MKNILFFAFVFLLCSCSVFNKASSDDKNDFFEGKIFYSISYSPYYDQISEEGLKERIGSKVESFFREGSYLNKYYSSNGKLLQERFLAISENKSYMKHPDNDTIYWIDLTRHDSKSTFQQIPDSTIIGEPCIGVSTETVVTGVGFDDNAYKVSAIYYYSKYSKVDPDWYKDCKEGNLNEIIKIGQGVKLLEIASSLYWEKTMTATSIERTKIEDDELRFAIPENAILKEL